MIRIDGSFGEGGGQVLRTSLGLSVVTGQPVTIENIRAGRKKPGLQRQHLTAVLAATEISDATTDGAAIGSQRLVFKPRTIRAGSYEFSIGTAGSTTLVLQTILPGLWAADGPSTVELTGGTHNPMAPPFDFLERSLAPLLHRMGASIGLELIRHGFYPAGGGLLRAEVAKAAWQPITLEREVDAPELRARIVNCSIPAHVPEREARVLGKRLNLTSDRITIEGVESPGPGNAVMVTITGPETTELVTSFADRRTGAEAVAERAARAAARHLAARVPVGGHLADQLLLPMALAGGGSFATVTPTDHTRTNAHVIERFLPVRISIRENEPAWHIGVESV